MSILVINGSPKGQNSNTFKLAEAFLDGAGYADADIIDVYKLNIKPCVGCFACWKKTPGKCVIPDDMATVLGKIISADIIVWSFPLYYFSIPGGLKNVIDRQLPMNLPFMIADSESGGHPSHYDLSYQRHVVISTCGFWTSNQFGLSSNYGRVHRMVSKMVSEILRKWKSKINKMKKVLQRDEKANNCYFGCSV